MTHADALATIDDTVRGRRTAAATLSRELHDLAETAFEEHRSSALLRDQLVRDGFRMTAPVAGLATAFLAEHGSGSPRIAIMVEYDALPGIGHGCGHNLIAAGGLLAAASLKRAMTEHGIDGSLVVVGTPGEEGGGGKALELDAGVFEDVDAAMMFHPSDRTILARRMYACLHYRVRFHGTAAHAAKNPESGRNALSAMLLFFAAVDALRQHSGDDARMHGIISHGGTAPNVVPELTEAVFIVRETTLDRAELLGQRVHDCARGAALSTGTTAEIDLDSPPYAHLESNATMVDRLAGHLTGLGHRAEPPSPRDRTGSTDAGNVSLRLPTVHPFLQIAPRGTPSHSREFAAAAVTDTAHDAMADMANALARLGLDLLTEPSFLGAAIDEFDRRRAAGEEEP